MLHGPDQLFELYQLFITRIRKQLDQYAQEPNSFPAHIQRLISLDTLIALFKDILENSQAYYGMLCQRSLFRVLKGRLPQTERKSKDGSAYEFGYSVRIRKKNKSSRTFYILHDSITNEIILIVQTKSRLSNNMHDEETSIPEGGFKKPDVAWRLDCPVPIAWISLSIRFKAKNKEKLSLELNNKEIEKKLYSAYIEAIITEDVYHKARKQLGEQNPFLYPLITPLHDKKGIQKFTLFFRRVEHSLSDIFRGVIPNPGVGEIRNMVFDLFRGLQFLHSNNLIHQDLSVRNLLFSVNDRYRLFIIDFGLMHTSTYLREASAPYFLASPEIEGRFSIFRLRSNNTYLNSYGKFLNGQDCDRKICHDPHPANDIWTVGLVLAAWTQPYFRRDLLTSSLNSSYAMFEASVRANPFYAGLLAHEREKRFTAQQAITCLTQNPELLELKLVNCSQDPALMALVEQESFAKVFFERIVQFLNKSTKDHELRDIFSFVSNHRRNIRFLMTSPSMFKGTELGFFCDLPKNKTKLDTSLRICFVQGQGFVLLKEFYESAVRALRIDCFPIVDYAIQKIDTKNLPTVLLKVRMIERYNQKFSVPHFLEECIGGIDEIDDNNFKVTLISPFPTGSLRHYLYLDGNTLQPEEIHLFVKTVLCALDVMHDDLKVHQALRFISIGYFKEGKAITRFVLLGLGHVRPFSGWEPYHFASPEIFDSKFEKDPSYAAYKLRLREEGKVTFDLTTDPTPHPANDMWALGVMFLILLRGIEIKDYSEHQSFIEKHPLLSGLLQSDRGKRLTAKNALEIFKQCEMKWFTGLEPQPIGFTPQYDAQRQRRNSVQDVEALAEDLEKIDLNVQTLEKFNWY